MKTAYPLFKYESTTPPLHVGNIKWRAKTEHGLSLKMLYYPATKNFSFRLWKHRKVYSGFFFMSSKNELYNLHAHAKRLWGLNYFHTVKVTNVSHVVFQEHTSPF